MSFDNPIIIYIGIAALVLLIIFICVQIKRKRELGKEKPASILDVDINGVSSDRTFDYGYEKEDTIVMEKVTDDKNKKTKKTNKSKKK